MVLWESATVQSALLVVAAGTVVVVIQHGLLPFLRHRARGRDLERLRIRRVKPVMVGNAAQRGEVEWVVPLPPVRLVPAIQTRLSAAGVGVEKESGALRVMGRAGSHWNPNRVNPAGFEVAAVRVEAAGGGESRMDWRIRKSGDWRAAVSTAGFVGVASALCLMGERGRESAPVVVSLLMGFGLMGFLFRRWGQTAATRGWIEDLLLEACREAGPDEVIPFRPVPGSSGVSRA